MSSPRPWLIRVAPVRLKSPLYYRLYRRKRHAWARLYDSAELYYAPGIKMNLAKADEGHSAIAFTGFYEIDLTRRLFKHAEAGGLFVDVGANYGYFSLMWAARRSGNKVIAFEASPRNHAPLIENIRMNDLEDAITLRTEAVGKASGTMMFEPGPEEQTGWGGLSLSEGKSRLAVPVVRLDDVLADLPEIACLKIDIEGADTWAIMGAERLLREKRIKTIYFEQYEERMLALGIGAMDATNFLKDCGYDVRPFGELRPGFGEYCATPKS